MPGPSSASGFIRNYTRVLRLIWAASPRTAAIAALLALISAAVLPAQIWVTKLIIDGVADIVAGPSKAWWQSTGKPRLHLLSPWLWCGPVE